MHSRSLPGRGAFRRLHRLSPGRLPTTTRLNHPCTVNRKLLNWPWSGARVTRSPCQAYLNLGYRLLRPLYWIVRKPDMFRCLYRIHALQDNRRTVLVSVGAFVDRSYIIPTIYLVYGSEESVLPLHAVEVNANVDRIPFPCYKKAGGQSWWRLILESLILAVLINLVECACR